jgi:hypothetical protein
MATNIRPPTLLSRSFFGMQLSFISRERLFLASATYQVKARVRPSFRAAATVALTVETRAEGEGEIGDFPMDGNIFNSQGVRVGAVIGSSIFSPTGKKLYDLRGIKIYKLSGELVGHLANVSERRLDRATDKLFPAS